MKINENKWWQNVPWIDRPNADIDSYCKLHKEDRYDLKEKLQSWQKDGAVVFENILDTSLIDQLLEDIDFLIQNPKEFTIEIDHLGDRKPVNNFSAQELSDSLRLKLINIHHHSLAAKKLSLNVFATSFLKHIFQDSVCAMQSLTFNRGSEQPAHADYAFVNYHKTISYLAATWIALEDIHPDSGPLAYYPGTHRVSEFGFFDFGDGEIIQTDFSDQKLAMEFGNHLYNEIEKRGIKKIKLLPKKGDVLIWHSALVHEGLKVNNPNLTRKSYITHYSSVKSYPEEFIKKDESNNYIYFETNNGIIFENPGVDNEQSLPSAHENYVQNNR